MKAFVRIAMMILVITMLVACKPQEAAQEAAELTPKEEWLKANQLGPYYTDEQDWAAIEAAAIEEGEVLVYANSSKIEKSAEAFMEK